VFTVTRDGVFVMQDIEMNPFLGYAIGTVRRLTASIGNCKVRASA
jgi:hypothetical protein